MYSEKQRATHTLRVNIKSLANESKIIRKETKKCKDSIIKGVLNFHRVETVRKESRITQLAYAAIRGIPYSKIEPNPKSQPDWKKVESKIKKHTHYMYNCDVWINEAKNHCSSLCSR